VGRLIDCKRKIDPFLTWVAYHTRLSSKRCNPVVLPGQFFVPRRQKDGMVSQVAAEITPAASPFSPQLGVALPGQDPR
jgi:hypothetical protein